MPIILTKIAASLIYPLGLFTLLIAISLLLGLAGRRRCAGFLMCLSVLLILVAASSLTADFLTSKLERQYEATSLTDIPAVDTLVMLGGVLQPPIGRRKNSGLIVTSDRMLHASRLFRLGKAKQIYLSGGNVFAGYFEHPESYYARLLLVEWGVPVANIDIGEASRTTYENAMETKQYLRRRGILDQPIILVTSALHMPRAVAIFTAAGINIIPAPTDILATTPFQPTILSSIPSANALMMTTNAWHELVGLWYYRLRGWAKTP